MRGDEEGDVADACTNSDTDADFAFTPEDGVVQHAVEADGGEQEADGGEEQREQGEETFADALVVDKFLLSGRRNRGLLRHREATFPTYLANLRTDFKNVAAVSTGGHCDGKIACTVGRCVPERVVLFLDQTALRKPESQFGPIPSSRATTAPSLFISDSVAP